MKLLEGSNAIVTGGAQGISRATSRLLAEHGARAVVVADLDEQAAQAVVDELPAGEVSVRCDVRSPDAVREEVAACRRLGSVDVVVNNAGITREATLRTLALDDWDAVLDVHLKGAFLMSQAAAAVMREQSSGAIINVSSSSGKVGMVGQASYSAAKAGMIDSPRRLRRSSLTGEPGQRRTARLDPDGDDRGTPQDVWDQKMPEIPMGRGRGAEQGRQGRLLPRQRLSSYLTGIVLEVTGGRFI